MSSGFTTAGEPTGMDHMPGSDTGPREGFIGIGTIKKDRFVALEASFDGGTVLTKPVFINGNTLYINANAKFGSIDVEVLDITGTPLAGFSTTIEDKNMVSIPVVFSGKSVSDLVNLPILLRFTLRNAQLYSVWAE